MNIENVNINELAELLDSISLELNHIKKFKIEKNMFLLLKFFAIISLASDTVKCLQTKAFYSIDIITRALLETLADFSNLLKDPGYAIHLEYSDKMNWHKMLKERKDNPSNEYLESFSAIDIDEEIRKSSAHLQNLQQKGAKELSIYQRFELANALDIYRTVYCYLCKTAHGDISSLFNEYLSFNDNGIGFVGITPFDNDGFNHIIETDMKVVSDSCLKIQKEFNLFSIELINICKMKLGQ